MLPSPPFPAQMRPLILKMDCSLDGYVGRSNGELDWLFPGFDQGHATWLTGRLWQAGAHLMGSVTYAGMASHWPNSTEPYAAPMDQIQKIVFSRGGLPTPRGETRVMGGDLVSEITQLKQMPGKPLLAHGGARFAQALVGCGVVDEYWLIMHPIVLGGGLKPFSRVGDAASPHTSEPTHFRKRGYGHSLAACVRSVMPVAHRYAVRRGPARHSAGALPSAICLATCCVARNAMREWARRPASRLRCSQACWQAVCGIGTLGF